MPALAEEADEFDDEVVTLIADSESDSFEGFENLDFSAFKNKVEPAAGSTKFAQPPGVGYPESKPSAAPFTPAQFQQQASIGAGASGAGSSIATAKSAVRPGAINRPKNWQPVNASISLFVLMSVIGLFALGGIGYLAFQFLLSGSNVNAKTQLELSAVGSGYSQAIFEIKKAQRVLSYLERAYLEKKLPDGGLANARALMQEFQQLVDDSNRLEEANRKFDSGDREGAFQILNEQIKLMSQLKSKFDKEISSLKLKVYGK